MIIISFLCLYGLLKISSKISKPKSLSNKDKFLSVLVVLIVYISCYLVSIKYPTDYFILSTIALCFGLLANYFTANNYIQQWDAWVVQNVSNLLIWVCIAIETKSGYGQLASMIIFLLNTLVSKYNYTRLGIISNT